MNTPQVAVKNQPKLLQVLSYQDEINERLLSKVKDLNEIGSRLDGLANRLNSLDYPKNFPKEISTSPDGSQLTPSPQKPDGIVGELISVNDRSFIRVDELGSAINSIFTAINYLEEHI